MLELGFNFEVFFQFVMTAAFLYYARELNTVLKAMPLHEFRIEQLERKVSTK